MKNKPVVMTIDELEKLLNSESDEDLEILPDGTIKRKVRRKKRGKKPLTMKENFGGEYGETP